MRKKRVINWMVILSILLTGCKQKKDTLQTLLPPLVKAEHIMYEYPDSALHILQEMQMPASSDKLQKATWALLLTQAKYKNYIEEVEDSTLINIAYNYFMQQEDAQRRAMVLYYKGILCKKAGKTEEAQKLYLAAIEEVEKLEDYQLAHLIYVELGEFYVFRELYEDAFKNFEKALHYAELANNDKYICSSYIFLARAISALNQMNTSIEYYQKAILLAEKIKDNYLCSGAMNELAGIYTNIKDYQSALKYAQKALQINETDEIESLGQNFLGLGEIYYYLAIPDSAYYYFNKALYSSSIYTVRAAYQGLYYVSRDNHEYEKISVYCDQLLNYQDSIQTLNKSRELAEIQKKYDQQKIINENSQLEMDKKNMLNMILLAGIGIAMGIAIMVYVYQKKLLRKERLLQRKEEEINQNTIKIQENEMIIVRNRNRMEELTMQIEENKGVQEQLEEQHKALVEIQQQNESLKQENETLQNNIDKYSFTLNEKSNELNRLEILTKENQLLRDRETYLSNLLIKDIRVIKNLKDKKSPINILQWDEIKKNIDLLFDNYTIRLSQVIPSMTESDLQVCCLIKLRFSNLDIADILNISPTSVSKRKFRLKERIIQKLGSLGESHTLDLWLLEF